MNLITEISQEQRRSLSQVMLGNPHERARNWLLDNYMVAGNGDQGWPHVPGDPNPSEWGGTLDALRGLLACGVRLNEPKLSGALEWLLSRQHPDGGFGSREMGYSAAEPTAWTLVLLHEAGFPASNGSVIRALGYLRACLAKDGSVGTSPLDCSTDVALQRIYPAALACWALGLWSDERAKDVARYLWRQQIPASGLWSVRPGAAGNAATTAQVIVALLASSSADANEPRIVRAIEAIVALQLPDGSWESVTETWFSLSQPNIPLQCQEYTTGWALFALSRAGVRVDGPGFAGAVDFIVRSQQPDGAWIHDELDGREYVWCVGRAIEALTAAKGQVIEYAAGSLVTTPYNARVTGASLAFQRFLQFVRVNILGLVVAILVCLYARDYIVSFVNEVMLRIKPDLPSVANNLISQIVWVGSIFVMSYILNRIRNR